MKRLLSAFLFVIITANLLVIPAIATDNATGYTIRYEDGSYAIVTFCSDGFARSTTDKFKTYTYYNPLGQKCFAYTLYAAFTYNGTTSHADSCDFGAAIYRQGWDIQSHSEYTSGNTAYGNATFVGPEGQVRTANLTLTCDKNGNVT